MADNPTRSLLLVGHGRMGRLIEQLAPEYGATTAIVQRPGILTPDLLDGCDGVIDFSSPAGILERIEACCCARKPIVVGTTGWDPQPAKACVERLQGTACFSPNYAIGVALFMHALEAIAPLMARFQQYDASLVDTHHRAKKDAPSGTALAIARVLNTPPQTIASVRTGHNPGEHTVRFDSPDDCLTFTHAARTRNGMARGALQAAHWLMGKQGWYTLADLIREQIA